MGMTGMQAPLLAVGVAVVGGTLLALSEPRPRAGVRAARTEAQIISTMAGVSLTAAGVIGTGVVGAMLLGGGTGALQMARFGGGALAGAALGAGLVFAGHAVVGALTGA